MRPDDQKEALEYNIYAIGIYKKKDDDCDELVGHVCAEISSLPYHFLRVSDDNYVEVEIPGKLELGLVVPAKYNNFTAKRQTAKILDPELPSSQCFLVISPENIRKSFAFCCIQGLSQENIGEKKINF